MSYPTEPKKLSVIERVIAVLNDIVEGDDYFYTPGDVQGKKTHWMKQLADLSYAAIFAGAEDAPVHHAGYNVEETFSIVVIGDIKNNDGELQKMIPRCLRDVRSALFADMAVGTAGTLGILCRGLQLGPWTSGVGQGPSENQGHFEQQFMFTISGDIKDL